MLRFIFFFFKCVISVQKRIFRIQGGTSLFMPAVEENGISHRYEYIGDYVITTYSSGNAYAKLGYNGSPSTAGMITKTPMNSKAFRIDVRMSIKKIKSDGIAFWISNDSTFEKGSVFGRKGVDGLLIAIVTRGDTQYIGINLGDNSKFSSFSQTVKLNDNVHDDPFTLRITHDKTLDVSLGKNNKFTDVFKLSDYNFIDDVYFGISVGNLSGYSDFKISAIRHSNIEYPVFRESSRERTSSSKWIWVLCFLLLQVYVSIRLKSSSLRLNKMFVHCFDLSCEYEKKIFKNLIL